MPTLGIIGVLEKGVNVCKYASPMECLGQVYTQTHGVGE